MGCQSVSFDLVILFQSPIVALPLNASGAPVRQFGMGKALPISDSGAFVKGWWRSCQFNIKIEVRGEGGHLYTFKGPFLLCEWRPYLFIDFDQRGEGRRTGWRFRVFYAFQTIWSRFAKKYFSLITELRKIWRCMTSSWKFRQTKLSVKKNFFANRLQMV